MSERQEKEPTRHSQHKPADATKDSGRYQRVLHELHGRRFIDLDKDTQFSDAWVVLGIVLTVVGLILDNGYLTTAALALFVIALASSSWSRLSLFGLHYRRHFSETRAFNAGSAQPEVSSSHLVRSKRHFLGDFTSGWQ
jgi:hypothetical protein